MEKTTLSEFTYFSEAQTFHFEFKLSSKCIPLSAEFQVSSNLRGFRSTRGRRNKTNKCLQPIRWCFFLEEWPQHWCLDFSRKVRWWKDFLEVLDCQNLTQVGRLAPLPHLLPTLKRLFLHPWRLRWKYFWCSSPKYRKFLTLFRSDALILYKMLIWWNNWLVWHKLSWSIFILKVWSLLPTFFSKVTFCRIFRIWL